MSENCEKGIVSAEVDEDRRSNQQRATQPDAVFPCEVPILSDQTTTLSNVRTSRLARLARLIASQPHTEIAQLKFEAQHRWLRPAEICEILRNYPKFIVSSEPPNRPSSGSFFLFDRKVLTSFRKDGHNWRKKKDGRTVKEAHEKLKVGGTGILHCYYAHGEDNECFQRRSYCLLEEGLMYIVFVHYLEVKGDRSSSKDSEPVIFSSQISKSLSSSVSCLTSSSVDISCGSCLPLGLCIEFSKLLYYLLCCMHTVFGAYLPLWETF